MARPMRSRSGARRRTLRAPGPVVPPVSGAGERAADLPAAPSARSLPIAIARQAQREMNRLRRLPAGAPEAAPPVLPRRPSTALGGRSLLIAVVAAVVIAVAFGFVSSLVETAPNLTPTVQFLGAGRWTVDLTATAAVGAEAGSAEGKARQQEFQGRLLQGAGILTVDLHAGDATIRTKDDSSFHHWEPLSGNGRTLTIRLLPAHPLLGERVTIRDDGDNRILTLDDQGVVLVLRPQTP